MNISEDGHLRDRSDDQDGPPPFMRSWNNIYIAVVIYTCVLILALYLVTIFLNH
jgi:hypothetical protein